MSKGFNGFPGGMGGNMAGLMKQAQKMQEDLKKSQEIVDAFVTDAQSGGGAVKITMSGKYKVLSVELSPEIVASADKEMLEDLIQAAVNEAVTKVQEFTAGEMGKATGGMSIPGLF